MTASGIWREIKLDTNDKDGKLLRRNFLKQSGLMAGGSVRQRLD